MDSPLFRDWVQRLIGYVPWKTFLACRLVCRMWHEVSKKDQGHWYRWLDAHGKCTFKFDKEKHENWICTELAHGRPCRDPRHYSTVERKVVILKTIPLCQQAMHNMIRTKRKKVMKDFNAQVERKRSLEDALIAVRGDIARFGKDLQVIQDMETTYQVKRKRTHIELNISK